MSKQIEALKKLGLTDEEIADVLESDRKIDQGEKLFELTSDQKKAEKTARATGSRATVYQFSKRERKADDDKRTLIQLLATATNSEVEMINPEREFTFIYNGKKYKVVLSAPRS